MPAPKDPLKKEQWKINVGNGIRGKKKPHSEAHIKAIRKAKVNNPNNVKFWLGKKRPEIKEKLSIALKGRKYPNRKKPKPFSKEHREKISKASKGKPKSLEHRKSLSGQNSHLWKGGVTPIHQKIRTSLEYKIWRRAVFERDNYTCVWCGDDKGGNLNADHIKPFALFPELRFAIDNGRTLCKPCHKKTNTYGGRFNKFYV